MSTLLPAPLVAPARLSLTGLASLVDDPLQLSVMLVALSGQPPFDDPTDALADKFATVSSILKSLEPAQAHTAFASLARNVLALPEEKRVGFLRHSVLPALVEGRVDGSMLRHFPDDSLAELVGTLEAARISVRACERDHHRHLPGQRDTFELEVLDRHAGRDLDRRVVAQ